MERKAVQYHEKRGEAIGFKNIQIFSTDFKN